MNKKEMLSMILKLEKHKLLLNLVIVEFHNRLAELSSSLTSQKWTFDSTIYPIRKEKTANEEKIRKEIEQADSRIGCFECIVWLLLFIFILVIIISSIEFLFGGVITIGGCILSAIIDLIVSALIVTHLDDYLKKNKLFDNKSQIEDKYRHDINDVNKRLEEKENELKTIELNNNKLYESVRQNVIREIVSIQSLIDRIDSLLSEYYSLCSFLDYNYQGDLLVISALYHFIENNGETNDDNITDFLNDIDAFEECDVELPFVIQREISETNKKYSEEIGRVIELYIESHKGMKEDNKRPDLECFNHGNEICFEANLLLKKRI